MNRRKFLGATILGASLLGMKPQYAAGAPVFQRIPFPVRFRKPSPYESLIPYVEAGSDEFGAEKQAAEITGHLRQLPRLGTVPTAPGFKGISPHASRYDNLAGGVRKAVYDLTDRRFDAGLSRWLAELGQVRSARFFVTEIKSDSSRADATVRFEVSSQRKGELQYRVGYWKQTWLGGRLADFEPLQETLVTSPGPLFADVTAQAMGGLDSFHNQLRRGIPYWRARLDSASGIDVYGNNGIAVGDIDDDGRDEIYICQPGGLPNLMYKVGEHGRIIDITERTGLGILDDTSCALFLDLRNSGRQDLVVLCAHSPLLFLNQGDGTFQHRPDAFQFARAPQGTFTGMSAADFDRDGRVDLYLCSYVYFQSEDQYHYPVPYHDARNGPPNFLFRNELDPAGGGVFRDVTGSVGLDQNNDRYSFAPAWSDYDGDGWPDLYVANDFGRNNLYKNEKGRFRDVAAAGGVEDIGPGMSAAWFDYDNDGTLDLYVSNMWSAAGQRVVRQKEFKPGADAALKAAYIRHSKGNSLYRNRGDGTFEEAGAREGLEMGRWAWCADALDFDNDGSCEVYVTCGMITHPSENDLESFFWRQVVSRTPVTAAPSTAYENGWNALNQLIRGDYSWNGRETNVYYRRSGGRYFDLSGISGLDVAEDSRAFAATDFDGDGNLDLFLKSRLGPQVRVFRNQCGTSRNSLALKLVGTKSNRDGIGARVEVETTTDGKNSSAGDDVDTVTGSVLRVSSSGSRVGGQNEVSVIAGSAPPRRMRRIIKSVQAGSGYLSQHTKVLYFGLRQQTAASRVLVQWPSGLKQEFRNLAAGFRHEIKEGVNQVKSTPFAKRAAARDSAALTTVPDGVLGENAPDLFPTWLMEPVPLPEKRSGPAFLLLTAQESPAASAGLPFQIVNLKKEGPDVAAWYALLRRYLFDWRTGLTLPLLLLIDERSRAHKIYPNLPDISVLREDLNILTRPQSDAERQGRSLPFAGRYYRRPHRKYFQLGAAFFSAGYPEQALQYLDEVLRQDPSNFKALLAVGQIHLEAGRPEEARHHLNRALRLNGNSPEVWNNLGGVEMAAENYRAALENYQKALKLNPDLAYALVNAGQALTKLGDWNAAEKMFRRALQVDSGDPDAANQLGLLVARQNRFDEARSLFQQAIASKRDHAGAINNLAVLYSQEGRLDDAVAALQYGIRVAPDAENAYLNLARLYIRMGNRERARAVLHDLLLRKPNSPVALKALEEMGDR
ncbi:MAG TPA: FG-GAP-like repeat-containing protein [Acidobacteriota bacterium]|jgi:tetratricopeptide (TPR) repeat protein